MQLYQKSATDADSEVAGLRDKVRSLNSQLRKVQDAAGNATNRAESAEKQVHDLEEHLQLQSSRFTAASQVSGCVFLGVALYCGTLGLTVQSCDVTGAEILEEQAAAERGRSRGSGC